MKTKCLIYCTKAKPHLSKDNYGRYYTGLCNEALLLNGTIVAECEVETEGINFNGYFCPSDNEYTKEFDIMDFQNFYNAKTDYQDLSAWFKFYYPGMKEILYTLEDCSDPEYKFHKKHKLIMGELSHGKGKIIVSTLSALDGCVGFNPILDKLFINIIEEKI